MREGGEDGEEGGEGVGAGRERSLYTCVHSYKYITISMYGWRNIQSSTCMSVALNYSSYMYMYMTFIGGATKAA